MKKSIRIITTITLVLAILFLSVWYLFVYDRPFTRDVLLSCARTSEGRGNHAVAAWFYDLAYAQSNNSDSVAIELSQQYKKSGNYTKAEYTLYNAISNGGGVDVYIALSKLYIEQDKLLDAVTMLNSVADPEIKAALDAQRPTAPTVSPEPGFYNQYISVTLETANETVYCSVGREYPSVGTEPYSEPITLSEGENIINAVAVNETGLVSTLSTFSYTVGGVVELVEFQDTAIELEIRAILNVDTSTILYTNDLWAITEFEIPEDAKNYADIKHLSFLKKLTVASGKNDQLAVIATLNNLTELTITDTSVNSDVLTGISKLPFLTKLTLTNCSLSDISVLKAATTITNLDLSNNAIRDISCLAELQTLQELTLHHNALTDLTPLSGVTSLVSLDISHNSITTLAPIATLTSVETLYADANLLTELGSLNKLTNLKILSLSENKLENIDVLAECVKITELNISTNLIKNIECLSEMNDLAHLNFSHNQVVAIPEWDKDCALITIDGSYNKVKKLDNLAGLSHLNIITMDHNESITQVDVLANCPMLIEVNVFGTGVTDARLLKAQGVVVNYSPV